MLSELNLAQYRLGQKKLIEKILIQSKLLNIHRVFLNGSKHLSFVIFSNGVAPKLKNVEAIWVE